MNGMFETVVLASNLVGDCIPGQCTETVTQFGGMMGGGYFIFGAIVISCALYLGSKIKNKLNGHYVTKT